MANTNFANDRFEGPNGNLIKNQKWVHLAEMLNAIGGAYKTVDRWQKYWADQKREVKKRAADLRVDHQSTGGGVSCVKPLTPYEEKVLMVINPRAAYGTNIIECGFVEVSNF